MEDVFKIIKKLYSIRNIPQFIFIDGISPLSTHLVRESIIKFIEKNPDKKEIDFILESPGGSADDAYRIIRAFRNNFEKVNIIVPFWAKSAATLLAFGGSTIIMDEFGEFGPLDAQLPDDDVPTEEYKSALIDEYALGTIERRAQSLYPQMMKEILSDKSIRIKKNILSEQILTYISTLYRPLLANIDPYQIGSKSRDLAVAEKYAEMILAQFNKENLSKDIDYFVDFIVHECPHHGFIIDYSVVSQFLKNVHRSSEISIDYCQTLTLLSRNFFTGSGKYKHIGFYHDGLIEKKVIVKDKKSDIVNKEEVIKKEVKSDEKKDNTN